MKGRTISTSELHTRAITHAVSLRSAAGARTLSGYAIRFGELSGDLGGFRERIDPGAWNPATAGADVVATFNHSPNQVLGRRSAGTLRLFKDGLGIRYEIDVPDTTTGRDVAELVRRRDVAGSSFTFRVNPGGQEHAGIDPESGLPVQVITSMTVVEVGPVLNPAYSTTTADTRSRSLADPTSERPTDERGELMSHAISALAHLEKREVAAETLRDLIRNRGDDSPTRSADKRENALREEIRAADESVRNHLKAAADEERGVNSNVSALLSMGTTTLPVVRESGPVTAGDLMSRSLELARGITTPSTGKAFSPEQYARNFLDLLAPQSVVMESGVQRVETAAETYAFPVIRSDFTAGFVGELDSLPTGGFGADPLKVTPRKIAAAELLANELMQDGGTAFLNPIAKSLMRSVALGFDREALVGTGAGKGFVGIANTPGIQKLPVTGGLANLDPFVKAFGLLEKANAKATAVVLSPTAWALLMALRESQGSLKPLLSESAGSPTSGVKRSILGVPVWLSSFVADAEILVYEADQIYAVWRKSGGFEISDQSGFFSDGTGVRCIARAAIAVPNAAAVCKLTIAA